MRLLLVTSMVATTTTMVGAMPAVRFLIVVLSGFAYLARRLSCVHE